MKKEIKKNLINGTRNIDTIDQFMNMANTYEKKGDAQNSILRVLLVFVAVLIQLILVSLFVDDLGNKYDTFNNIMHIVAIIIVIGIFSQDKNINIKMPWIVIILISPIAGVVIYLIVGYASSGKRIHLRYNKIGSRLSEYLPSDEKAFDKITDSDKRIANITQYIRNKAKFPLYNDSNAEYFANQIEALKEQKKELKKAKKFIFMEYHAIEDGEVFSEIKDILIKKVEQGVDVRVLYDDIGSGIFVNDEFAKRLRKSGIKCKVFNPISPVANFFFNNRDHRKITVIDGRVAFTGGYNIAGEYFGLERPFGKWKDSGILIRGNAVKSLTFMFLEMWIATDKARDFMIEKDIEKFFPSRNSRFKKDGFIQPYGDKPIDNIRVGEDIYMLLCESAKNYLWIMTPYLIITDEMNRALCLAAERGVDVRIIVPGIPDKRTIYGLTRSYYPNLIQHGVKIFEYVPGFCHSKLFICDDKVATCGTVNLDYRSLYHHFENGIFLYNCEAVTDIKNDFDETFKDSIEIKNADIKKRNILTKIWQHILRLMAPLA